MPIYEYECGRCGVRFEELVVSDSGEVTCPECRGTQVSKLMSVCAFSVGSSFKSTAPSDCGSCKSSPASCSSCGVKH